MTKTILMVAVGTLIGVVVYWNWQQRQIIQEQQHKIDLLVSQRSAAPESSLGQQQQCAVQAARAFEFAGYKDNEWANFTNHFSSKLGRCFVEITALDAKTNPGTIWTYKTLSDAFEGKTYGQYSWHTVKGKKYWEVPPFECSLFPDGTQSSLQVCKTEVEFDDFASSLMQN